MALMTWSDQLSVNIKQVDSQHMKLVELLNNFHDSMKMGKGKEAMGKTFSELLDYTAYHFGTEEELFKKYGYPAFSTHKKEHEALTKKATELNQRFSLGDLAITIDTMTFLKNWLYDHIMGSDKKYAPFLNEKGVN